MSSYLHIVRVQMTTAHRLTLELYNLGPTTFTLTAGVQPIGNLTIITVVGTPLPTESTTHGQMGPCGTPAGHLVFANQA